MVRDPVTHVKRVLGCMDVSESSGGHRLHGSKLEHFPFDMSSSIMNLDFTFDL